MKDFRRAAVVKASHNQTVRKINELTLNARIFNRYARETCQQWQLCNVSRRSVEEIGMDWQISVRKEMKVYLKRRTLQL